jgi:hypothetical protein
MIQQLIIILIANAIRIIINFDTLKSDTETEAEVQNAFLKYKQPGDELFIGSDISQKLFDYCCKHVNRSFIRYQYMCVLDHKSSYDPTQQMYFT